jgi:hypothetical protein
VQRRLKHHHERTVEAVPELPERIAEHQSLFHSRAFAETLARKIFEERISERACDSFWQGRDSVMSRQSELSLRQINFGGGFRPSYLIAREIRATDMPQSQNEMKMRPEAARTILTGLYTHRDIAFSEDSGAMSLWQFCRGDTLSPHPELLFLFGILTDEMVKVRRLCQSRRSRAPVGGEELAEARGRHRWRLPRLTSREKLGTVIYQLYCNLRKSRSP